MVAIDAVTSVRQHSPATPALTRCRVAQCCCCGKAASSQSDRRAVRGLRGRDRGLDSQMHVHRWTCTGGAAGAAHPRHARARARRRSGRGWERSRRARLRCKCRPFSRACPSRCTARVRGWMGGWRESTSESTIDNKPARLRPMDLARGRPGTGRSSCSGTSTRTWTSCSGSCG